MARVEAVTRNTCVAVCRRAASGAALCAGEDGPWTTGWLVYENHRALPRLNQTSPPQGRPLRASADGRNASRWKMQTAETPQRSLCFRPWRGGWHGRVHAHHGFA